MALHDGEDVNVTADEPPNKPFDLTGSILGFLRKKVIS
jgi:hypothetical protein